MVIAAIALKDPQYASIESLTPVANYILEGEFPKEFTAVQRRKLIKQASTFLWLEGALYQKGKDLVCRRVPSTNEIPKILKGLHEEACGGHFSHELTLKKVLLAGYVWPSMHADVQHWCRSCHNCQVNGNKKLLYGPRQAVIANGPFEKWGIDAMGPLPRTANGKLYILVAIDYMTRFGTPLEIVSDNGPGFRRGLLTEVCIIRKMVESKPKHWDNFLDGAIWAYRTTYRDATQFTPFHLVYGQEALQPIELNIPTIRLIGRQEQNNDEAWIDRLLNLVELEWKREAAYHCYEKKALQLKDKLNERIKDKQIKEKSLVLRYNNALDNRFDAKFERRWEGPFIVKKAFTGGYYQLMDLNGKEHPRKVNGYRLKPYLSRILSVVFETKQVSKKTKKEEIADLQRQLETATQDRDLNANQVQGLIQDMLDVQVRLTHKEEQYEDLLKKEKKIFFVRLTHKEEQYEDFLKKEKKMQEQLRFLVCFTVLFSVTGFGFDLANWFRIFGLRQLDCIPDLWLDNLRTGLVSLWSVQVSSVILDWFWTG
ncbi:hypothetical protein L7F22_054824 [Adiantum nelumboides]|nr:hypothetical protein [Adiantum nelumboides]